MKGAELRDPVQLPAFRGAPEPGRAACVPDHYNTELRKKRTSAVLIRAAMTISFFFPFLLRQAIMEACGRSPHVEPGATCHHLPQSLLCSEP
jgi:hypothetical protein